jgi:hypothetical protein
VAELPRRAVVAYNGGMARNAPRPRSRSQTQTATIRRLLITDALASWVVPTVAAVVIALALVLNALGLLADAPAAATAVVALLVIGAFMIVAPFLHPASEGPAVPLPALLGAMVAWAALLYYPFHARMFTGPPLVQVHVDPAVHGVPLAVGGHGDTVDLIVEAHLPLASEQRDRSVVYDLDLVDANGSHSHYSGELGDRWRTRRIGRRGTAPTRLEHLSTEHLVDDPGGGDLRLEQATITGEPTASLSATFYRHRLAARGILYAGAGLLTVAALAFDHWSHPRETPLATLLTATAAAAALAFTASGSGHPGIRDVIGAILVGAVAGVPIGLIAAWIMQRLVPHRSQAKARRRA